MMTKTIISDKIKKYLMEDCEDLDKDFCYGIIKKLIIIKKQSFWGFIVKPMTV